MNGINAYPKWMLTIIVILNLQASIDLAQGNPTVQNNVLLQCPRTRSCQGRCKDKEMLDTGKASDRHSHCHCDLSCSKYNDCCHDILTACPNRTSPKLPNNQKLSCLNLTDDEPHYWMLGHCPPTYKDKAVREKCENNDELRAETFFEQIPVYDMISNNSLFKNIWCAKCHLGRTNWILYFKLKIKCNVRPPKGFNSTQTLKYMIKHCDRIQFKLPSKSARRFCFPTIDSCPASASAEERKACLESPASVVFSRSQGKNYRSMECMACNVNASVLRKAECGPQAGGGNLFNPSSFEVVMTFIKSPFGEESKIVNVKTTETCNKARHVYDGRLEMCRKALIAPTKGVTDKVQFKMLLSPLDGKKPVNFSSTEFVQVLAHRFAPLDADQMDVLSVQVEDKTTAVLFNLRAKHHDVSQLNKTKDTLGLDRLFKFDKPFKLNLVNRPWLVFKVNSRRLSCTHKEEFPATVFKPLPNNDSKTFKVEIDGKIRLIPKNQVYTYQAKNATGLGQMTFVVCRSLFTVLCNHSMLAVVDKEYTIFKNKSLLFKPTGQWYNEGEYDTRGNTTWICTNYTISKHKDSKDNSTDTPDKFKFKTDIHFTIRRYMTIVGLSISVISLFLVLLTHGILRDLRAPLPGKNLMSLSLSLFLAHFWYLLGSGDTDKPVFCRFTGCFLHYLFLVTFGCTFIVAYDTRRTFSAKTGKARGLGGYFQNRRLAVYLLISWGIPLIFVTICAILDGVDVVNIGYGKGLACWIGNPTALLIVFATPIGLVLVYNVVAFSQTVYAINSARKHGQRVKSNHYTRPAVVKIYMRLTSLMGFSWFFAISAPLIHDGLMYPFVFFTTLQGLYIFLAFVFKTKVLRMIKAKLPLENRRPSSSSSSSRRVTKGTMSTMADTTPYNKYMSSPKDDTQI